MERPSPGPYLRALRAALRSLAPDRDFPAPHELDAHFAALDPALSGPLLLPAEIDPDTGLPALAWLARATAEAAITAPPPAAPAGLAARDPELAERLSARVRLHAYLRDATLHPPSRLTAQIRRRAPTEDVTLAADRHLPAVGFTRLRLDLSGPPGWSADVLTAARDGRVIPTQGLRHLLARHTLSRLSALQAWLTGALEVEVPRLSRGVIGPFWFGEGPPERPAPFRGGLALHLSREILARDVRASSHRDPLTPPPAAPNPAGYGRYTERRLAVLPRMVAPVTRWGRGRLGVVVPIR